MNIPENPCSKALRQIGTNNVWFTDRRLEMGDKSMNHFVNLSALYVGHVGTRQVNFQWENANIIELSVRNNSLSLY